jgi:hypothetical protein
MVMIRINHLLHLDSGTMRFGVVTRDNPHRAKCSENGRILLVAGQQAGYPALCLLDNPSRPGFDPEAIYARLPFMGIPRAMMEELLKNCRQEGI